jgi:hypothetical protein
MFGSGEAKLPITEEDRARIDRSLARLADLLGIQRIMVQFFRSRRTSWTTMLGSSRPKRSL